MKNTKLAIFALMSLMILGVGGSAYGYVPGMYNQGPFDVTFSNNSSLNLDIEFLTKVSNSQVWETIKVPAQGEYIAKQKGLWKGMVIRINSEDFLFKYEFVPTPDTYKQEKKGIVDSIAVVKEGGKDSEGKPYKYYIKVTIKGFFVDSESFGGKGADQIFIIIDEIKKVGLDFHL